MAQLNPNGSVGGNDQNIPEAHVPRTRSTFPLKRHFFNTHRFGEYVPHFFADLNKNEDFPINSSHSLRTYTLKAPLMQNVTRNKDYFLVPSEAILPLNWEKFFDNPVRGDDVLDDVGPTPENFWSKVYAFSDSLITQAYTQLTSSGITPENALLVFLRTLIFLEYFYSNGNLLSSLGCHGSVYFKAIHQAIPPTGYNSTESPEYVFDDWFDQAISLLQHYMQPDSSGNYFHFTLTVDGWVYVVDEVNSDTYGLKSISLRHALQLMRDNPVFQISSCQSRYADLTTFFANFANDLAHAFGASTVSWMPDYYGWNFRIDDAAVPCKLERLWAYQLSVAHYFTNDHIDFIYSAELYRQLIGHYIRSVIGVSNFATQFFFTRNGTRYQYDYCSAKGFTIMLAFGAANAAAILVEGGTSSNNNNCFMGYLSALFGYRRSLRYLDYFTGSRAQPLAVVNTNQINTNVSVNNNQVSVIDITKSIQAQRFLNSVNRVRHNFEGYLKGIFGGEVPAPDYHNPFKLAHTDDVVFGQETENTASEQMNDRIAITTNLRSSSGNYVFEIHTDRPCIAIGISSYEIPRIYTKSTDRTFFHQNRFDWFNPFMQFTGDQPVYLQELGIKPGSNSLNTMSNFAYTIRHEEYKQWFNIASGGFGVPSTDLENWIFVARDRRGTQFAINPDWIRSLNAEFDYFYVSLSGWSLGTYFHFIVDDFNSCKASRPMAYAPQILG